MYSHLSINCINWIWETCREQTVWLDSDYIMQLAELFRGWLTVYVYMEKWTEISQMSQWLGIAWGRKKHLLFWQLLREVNSPLQPKLPLSDLTLIFFILFWTLFSPVLPYPHSSITVVFSYRFTLSWTFLSKSPDFLILLIPENFQPTLLSLSDTSVACISYK